MSDIEYPFTLEPIQSIYRCPHHTHDELLWEIFNRENSYFCAKCGSIFTIIETGKLEYIEKKID